MGIFPRLRHSIGKELTAIAVSPLSHLLHPLLRPRRLVILEAFLIGIVAALGAVCLKESVAGLEWWRDNLAERFPLLLVLPALGVGGGGLAGLLIQTLAPEAAGSGMPQVKAVLARVPMALNLRVALVKLGSAAVALGTGLALGPEGPTVQIGAGMAAQLSHWLPTSPDYRRQLIAAGGAAGLAAAFNAPITGMLFVIEELLQDVSSFTLGTAIIASFVGGVMSRVLEGRTLNLDVIVTSHQIDFTAVDIPLVVGLGLVTGGLAALLDQGVLKGARWTREHLNWSLPVKVALAGGISGLGVALLPQALGSRSDLPTLLAHGGVSWQLTLFAFAIQFVLVIVAAGLRAPGGLLTPTLVLGFYVGHLWAMAAHVNTTLPSIYAMAGMGAFMGAFSKVPVTAIVIVFELTHNFDLVLPLMICVVTAYLVAEKLSPGSLYTRLLALDGIHLEPEGEPEHPWDQLTAGEFMESRVETLPVTMKIEQVVQVFQESHHRGFPVVDGHKLVGIITESDLIRIRQGRLGPDQPLGLIMSPRPITVRPSDTLNQVLYLLSHYQISRLPVIEHNQLVGIITRSDILRVESMRLEPGEYKDPHPSYLAYQVRPPAVSQGRVILLLSNPLTATTLVQLGLRLARARDWELLCLCVVLIPPTSSPSTTQVDLTPARQILDPLLALGAAESVPLHLQARVAHTVSAAVLDGIREQHTDLLLMGWKGSTSTPGSVFSTAVDTLINHAPCDVMVVKANPQLGWRRWLLPMAGGPNAQHALELLPSLVDRRDKIQVQLCQIFQPNDTSYDPGFLQDQATFAQEVLGLRVTTTAACAQTVSEAVLDLAQNHDTDVVLIGATREGLLKQVILGNIPETIARQASCTVILVRKAVSKATEHLAQLE